MYRIPRQENLTLNINTGLTGGLAAPFLAAGAGAIIGGAGAAALGSVAGIAIIGSLFGVAGAGLGGISFHMFIVFNMTSLSV